MTRNMDEQLLALTERIVILEDTVRELTDVLQSTRVQIDDFEGVLKTLSSAPDASEWPDGAITLYDDTTNQRIYVKVNGAWKYATLT